MDILRDTYESVSGRMSHTGSGKPPENMAEHAQSIEAVINEGLRIALMEKNPDRSLEVQLEYLGKALDGERTYIFERNAAGCDDNTYEWVASGVQPEKENLQNLPPELCAGWYQKFSIGKQIVLKNLENIRQSDPLVYETLKRQDIRSVVVVPLYDDGRIIGFYGVDNPPARLLDYASNMLQIAAYFIVSSIRQRNLVRELKNRSYDVLNSLNVDYVGIYQVNFNTDKCEIYREKERLRENPDVNFENSYQEAMERYISMYVEPLDQERIRVMTEKSHVLAELKTKKKFYVRYRVKDNPQGVKNVELHFSTVENEKVENSAIFAFRDANAVVEQEEKYRLEAQRDIETVLEGARTGIWTIELEENCAPRMYADRTMRMLLGVGEDIGPEDCYQSWFQNIDPEYVDTVQEAVQEILDTGRGEVVYPWNHPTLGKIYIRCGGIPDKKFHKPGFCLNGYHQDITETMATRKKQDQAIMELLEKVRQANSAKSEFLSHMSHDLRTPINGIQGMLAIMEKNQGDLAKQAECREKINVSANHLLSLVNDVLEVSRLESGRLTDADEPFDLYQLVDECVAMLFSKAEAAGIRLEKRAFDLSHRKLIGNPGYLNRILTNIIDNAIKYNQPDGAVFIGVKELFFKDGVAHYQFTVEDTGIGIGEKFREHIFDPFTQEHQDARTDYNGTGLGMSIVKKLVDHMGGTIELESRSGKGTLVRITLSVQADTVQIQTAAQDEDKSADISGIRVLLAEDNEINREIVQFILEDAGAAVVTAKDGQTAVNTFSDSELSSFDCILMDLMMPVMSGLEAARTIRSMDRPDAQSVPIIALSANAFAEDVAMSKGAGMDAHLSKPIDINRLCHTMCRLINDK